MELTGVLKELGPDKAGGKYSFGRVASAIVLLAWLCWVSYCVYWTRMLPAGIWEVSPVIVALYSVNKVTAVVAGNTDGK